MRRVETFLALTAVVLASVAALQVPGRLIFALAAIMLLVFVGSSRLRASLAGRKERRPGLDASDRAARIHEQRKNRYDR